MEEEDICHNITVNSGMQMYYDKQNLVRIKDNRIKYKPKDKGKRNKRTLLKQMMVEKIMKTAEIL